MPTTEERTLRFAQNPSDSDSAGGTAVTEQDEGPRGREHFEWILGWREAEDSAWSAQQARAEARRAAAAARDQARRATTLTPDSSLPAQSRDLAAAVSASRPTGEWDLAAAAEPELAEEDEPAIGEAPPRGREYFEWVLGWHEPRAALAAKHTPSKKPTATSNSDWLATLETQAPAPDEEFAFRDWMEPADVRTTSEFETIELEPPAEALPDEPATIEFETTEIAPDDLADRNEVVTGEFAAVEEAVTGEFAAVEEAVTGEFSTVMATEEEIDSPHADRSFVLKKFHSFYQEIIRFRHQKSTLAGGMATAVGDAAGVHASADPSNPARAAKEQSSKWRELLQLYAAEAKWLGGDKSGRYPDAQYVMVALADEVLATTDWLGRAAWEQHRLEPAFYQSSDAGAKVFRDIDELLRAQGTPANRDLALVYLMTLAAGFRGIYGDPGDDAKLAEYRRRLYHFAHRRDPRLAESRTLFPSTVAYTVEGRAVPRVSMVQRWLIVLAAALVAYLVIAHMVWTGAVADLTDVLGRIHDML